MFKRIGQMLVVDGTPAGAFRTDRLGPSVAYRIYESTTWTGKVNYKWQTTLIHNFCQKFEMDGNHIFDFAETVNDPGRGVVELSPHFYLYAKFPIALNYIQPRPGRLELSVVNQPPEILIWYDTENEARKTCRDILDHQMRLVTRRRGEVVVVEK